MSVAWSCSSRCSRLFQHANVRLRFPVIRWVINTPEWHHWHHGLDREAYDTNFGTRSSTGSSGRPTCRGARCRAGSGRPSRSRPSGTPPARLPVHPAGSDGTVIGAVAAGHGATRARAAPWTTAAGTRRQSVSSMVRSPTTPSAQTSVPWRSVQFVIAPARAAWNVAGSSPAGDRLGVDAGVDVAQLGLAVGEGMRAVRAAQDLHRRPAQQLAGAYRCASARTATAVRARRGARPRRRGGRRPRRRPPRRRRPRRGRRADAPWPGSGRRTSPSTRPLGRRCRSRPPRRSPARPQSDAASSSAWRVRSARGWRVRLVRGACGGTGSFLTTSTDRPPAVRGLRKGQRRARAIWQSTGGRTGHLRPPHPPRRSLHGPRRRPQAARRAWRRGDEKRRDRAEAERQDVCYMTTRGRRSRADPTRSRSGSRSRATPSISSQGAASRRTGSATSARARGHGSGGRRRLVRAGPGRDRRP